MKRFKGVIEVIADDGASQVFTAKELGLDPDTGYTEGEWKLALEKKNFCVSGIVSIS